MNASATLSWRGWTGGRPRRRWLQAAAIIVFWMVADGVASAQRWPIPGSVVGLALLWVVLDRGWLPAAWIEQGADGLLEHLMLFFVPAMLALVDHPEFLSLLGVKLLAAVVVGTLIVMCGTALVVEAGFRWEAKRHGRHA